MTDPGSERALAHARTCPACAASIRAARAVDRALREPVPVDAGPPADFVARVMGRVRADGVDAAAGATSRALAERPTPSPWSWIAGDPVSVVSVTLAVSIGIAMAWRPAWVTAVAAALVAAPGRWLSRLGPAPALSDFSAGFGPSVHPAARIGLGLGAAALILWGSWILYRRLERTLILFGAGRRI
jgi:hypothetical protein